MPDFVTDTHALIWYLEDIDRYGSEFDAIHTHSHASPLLSIEEPHLLPRPTMASRIRVVCPKLKFKRLGSGLRAHGKGGSPKPSLVRFFQTSLEGLV